MYEPKTFVLPELEGISTRTLEEHLKLYAGYVKHTNLILSELATVTNDYAKAEMQRRLGFEFGGMKNHEYYFAQFEGGYMPCPEGTFADLIKVQFGSLEACIERLKTMAMTRGVGWVMMYLDTNAQALVLTWVDEQHLGQLVDTHIVLALDMWEHSYMLDYPPSEKKQYVEAFFKNLNWEVVAARV